MDIASTAIHATISVDILPTSPRFELANLCKRDKLIGNKTIEQNWTHKFELILLFQTSHRLAPNISITYKYKGLLLKTIPKPDENTAIGIRQSQARNKSKDSIPWHNNHLADPYSVLVVHHDCHQECFARDKKWWIQNYCSRNLRKGIRICIINMQQS